jgi:transcriptional regulator with XRE-family HTH domain
MNGFRPARKRIEVSAGESVRILRELQELSQNDLARLTRIPQATISAIENDRVKLGVERAKVLASALRCHPAVLVFPGWDAAAKTERRKRRRLPNREAFIRTLPVSRTDTGRILEEDRT